jgi:hypothetical protein
MQLTRQKPRAADAGPLGLLVQGLSRGKPQNSVVLGGAMSDLPELPEEAGPIIFKQLFELWAHPEIEKRLAAAAMTPGQKVWAI